MNYFLITLIASLALTAQIIRADDPVVPGAGFPATRYEALWTKSPFAVATSETTVEASPDYLLVGFSNNIDGISYASVIERQSQEHFLISSDKPTRGLTLTSITRSADGTDTFANVQKDGQTITLKLEQAPMMPTPPGMAQNINAPVPMPNIINQQITMPGAGSASPFGSTTRPFARIHRSPIHLPPAPGHEIPPVQANTPPPPPPQ